MNSGYLNTSRLAIGTVQFGLDYGISNLSGKTRVEEVEKILNKAREYKINTLDTANAYGDSEQVIGKANSKDFNVVSKFPAKVITNEDLRTSLQLSLHNLKTNCLYGYLAHDADVLLKYPVLWKSLLELKKEKLVEKIGYSLYLPSQLEQLLSLNYTPDIVQVPYSFIDRRFEKYFTKLKSLGCEIHVRSVFLQGLFFLDPKQLQSFFDPIKPLLIELQHRFSDNKQMAGFLMNFVLSKPEVDKLVFGVNTEAQFVENIMNLELNPNNANINWNENVSEDILMPNKWPN